VDIKIDIERHKTVTVPQAQLVGLLSDIEGTLKRFPKLKKITVLGERDFRLDMQTIGSSIAKIAHDVSFGARCNTDLARAELSWKPLPKVGNAQVEGQLRLAGEGQSTRITLRVRGELHDVPVPLMYRLVAPAFIQGKFSALIDAFLEKLAVSAGGAKSQIAA
jgi:carbon monoxide dehydrogenase subunit G